MADEKVKFDKYQQVEEAIKKSTLDPDTKQVRLVTLVIVQLSNPISLHIAKEIEKIRKLGTAIVKSPIFVCDYEDDKNKFWELNVAATPVIQFFIAGAPLLIRRTGYAEDDKFVGSCSHDNLLEMFQSARQAENDQAKVMYLDF